VTSRVVLRLIGTSVLASVWTKQTRSAAVLIYGGLAAAAVAGFYAPPAVWAKLPVWFNWFNPLYALTTAYSTDDWRVIGCDLAQTPLAWGEPGAARPAAAV